MSYTNLKTFLEENEYLKTKCKLTKCSASKSWNEYTIHFVLEIFRSNNPTEIIVSDMHSFFADENGYERKKAEEACMNDLTQALVSYGISYFAEGYNAPKHLGVNNCKVDPNSEPIDAIRVAKKEYEAAKAKKEDENKFFYGGEKWSLRQLISMYKMGKITASELLDALPKDCFKKPTAVKYDYMEYLRNCRLNHIPPLCKDWYNKMIAWRRLFEFETSFNDPIDEMFLNMCDVTQADKEKLKTELRRLQSCPPRNVFETCAKRLMTEMQSKIEILDNKNKILLKEISNQTDVFQVFMNGRDETIAKLVAELKSEKESKYHIAWAIFGNLKLKFDMFNTCWEVRHADEEGSKTTAKDLINSDYYKNLKIEFDKMKEEISRLANAEIK